MTTATITPKHRLDYRPPDHRLETTELFVDIFEDHAVVRSRLSFRRNPEGGGGPLALHGEDLETREVRLDGRVLDAHEYRIDQDTLTLEGAPDVGVFESTVVIHPERNTALSGLYRSGSIVCTQCEAEGFRRITWFLDRPDVLSRFTVGIEADRARYPVLLSNGDRIDCGDAGGGRHWVAFRDPHPKPSYLFALVAGDLAVHRGTFRTRSGRDVALEIWVEHRNIDRCEHATRALQRAMAFDEEAFGREYDLDTYMIVAVSDFNMGAMENKGLNIFNAKYVLAKPETATDAEYESIEAVIAHEYFHNWTGNRVTVRDWFQLTLKEGLTVFRDQLFTAAHTSAAVKRISDVRALRTNQFAEDSGPTAHPIRPESYVEMNNFYTVTVYEKGAEVVRMYHSLLGAEGFRRGMDLYFERHDGHAVTCDDFRAAMGDANGRRFEQFERWYTTAGTPTLHVHGHHDPEAQTYTLTLRQTHPDPAASAFHLPVAVGLLGPDGSDLPLRLVGQMVPTGERTHVLELTEPEQRFVFADVARRPVPSVLRRFSAPVRIRFRRSPKDIAFQMAHDSDPFSRWDAGQTLAEDHLLDLIDAWDGNQRLQADRHFVAAWGRILTDSTLDGSFKSLALQLPEENYLSQLRTPVPIEAIHAAREHLLTALATAHAEVLLSLYEACAPKRPYDLERSSIDLRRLRTLCLGYLSKAEPEVAAHLAKEQYLAADNMTDRQGALAVLADLPMAERDEMFAEFFDRHRGDPLVIDKWFHLQARSILPDTMDRVLALAQHPEFTLTNPNRVRSLVGAFCSLNPRRFHDADGRGHRFLADMVIALDGRNPQLAARLVQACNNWQRFDAERKESMRSQLQRIEATPGLSKDVGEIVGKSLRTEPSDDDGR